MQAYDTVTRSGLDWLLSDLIASREVTYSRPLDYLSYRRDTVSINGQLQRVSPRLLHGGAHLSDPEHQWVSDLLSRGGTGLGLGLLLAGPALALFGLLRARVRRGLSTPPAACGATRATSPGAPRCGRSSSSSCSSASPGR